MSKPVRDILLSFALVEQDAPGSPQSYANHPPVTPMEANLEAILATASPFDDAFDSEVITLGEKVEPLPIWTQCGRRVDLLARSIGWQVLALREVIDDAQANWSGHDDAGWESDAHFI